MVGIVRKLWVLYVFLALCVAAAFIWTYWNIQEEASKNLILQGYC